MHGSLAAEGTISQAGISSINCNVSMIQPSNHAQREILQTDTDRHTEI